MFGKTLMLVFKHDEISKYETIAYNNTLDDLLLIESLKKLALQQFNKCIVLCEDMHIHFGS